jgi:hypothetical protein
LCIIPFVFGANTFALDWMISAPFGAVADGAMVTKLDVLFVRLSVGN